MRIETNMPVRLISKNKFPPQGWVYRQAETGWTAPDPMSSAYWVTVDQIIKHRLLNPGFPFATTREAVDWDLENYTCLRLKNSPQFCRNDDPSAPALIQLPRATAKSGCKTC